jgi:hypothetical protein
MVLMHRRKYASLDSRPSRKAYKGRGHRRVRTSIRSKRVSVGAASDASFAGRVLDHWRLGFKKPSFTLLTDLATHQASIFTLSRFLGMLFPLTFRLKVSPVTLGISLQSLPISGCTVPRYMVHRMTQVAITSAYRCTSVQSGRMPAV